MNYLAKYTILLFICLFTLAKAEYVLIDNAKKEFYQKAFLTAHFKEEISIKDNISKNPINNKLLKIYDKDKKFLGYLRNIETTTGCDGACLPVIFTLFYNPKKELTKLLSKPGLTKKYHARFTAKDYEKLDIILALNPGIFSKVGHPTEMVDVISGATKSEYQDSVVKEAAYTSLRVNLYNQDTLNILKSL